MGPASKRMILSEMICFSCSIWLKAVFPVMIGRMLMIRALFR